MKTNGVSTNNPPQPIAQLREQLTNLRNRDGWSNGRIARELGVSPATVSQLASGSYQAKSQEQMWNKVLKLLATLQTDGSLAVPLTTHIETPIAERITGALAWAHHHGDISLVFGLAGSGKTWTARRYADQHSGVTYISATPTCSSVHAFLALMARSLGLSVRGWSAKVEAAVLDALGGSTPRLLIVDEAHHLPQHVVDEARCLYDSVGQTNSAPFGMALLGNDPLRSTLMATARCAQIVSRIGRTVHLTGLASDDVSCIAGVISGGTPDAKLSKVAAAVASKPGAIRRLIKVGRDAIALAASEDRNQVTAADLTAAEEVRVG